MSSVELSGSCQCGSVRFTARPPFRPIIACHCVQCRKQTGHHMAAAAALRENFQLLSEESLTWFQSGTNSRRGFCSVCGSTLFFEVLGGDRMSFTAGSIDGPTGLEMTTHIFAAERGDYYDLPAGCDAYDGEHHAATEIPRDR